MSKKYRISDFDRDEKFDYESIPHHFESVSANGLKEISNECSATIRNKTNGEYKPATERALLQIISGKFDRAYQELEGDYTARKANLENAYSEGIERLDERIAKFKLLVNEHNQAYEQYSESLEQAIGKTPDKNLYFEKSELEAIENNFKKLGKE